MRISATAEDNHPTLVCRQRSACETFALQWRQFTKLELTWIPSYQSHTPEDADEDDTSAFSANNVEE